MKAAHFPAYRDLSGIELEHRVRRCQNDHRLARSLGSPLSYLGDWKGQLSCGVRSKEKEGDNTQLDPSMNPKFIIRAGSLLGKNQHLLVFIGISLFVLARKFSSRSPLLWERITMVFNMIRYSVKPAALDLWCFGLGQSFIQTRLAAGQFYHQGKTLRYIIALPRPVAVWCRFFDSAMCSKRDQPWAQAVRMNFAKMPCG